MSLPVSLETVLASRMLREMKCKCLSALCNYRSFATYLRDCGEKSAGLGVAIVDVVVCLLLGDGDGGGGVIIGIVIVISLFLGRERERDNRRGKKRGERTEKKKEEKEEKRKEKRSKRRERERGLLIIWEIQKIRSVFYSFYNKYLSISGTIGASCLRQLLHRGERESITKEKVIERNTVE